MWTRLQKSAPHAIPLGLFALSGVAYGLAYEPYNIWGLAWFALIPALAVLHRTSATAVAVGGLLFGLGIELVAARWTLDLFGAGALAIWMIFNLVWMTFFLFAREAVVRWGPLAHLWAVPILWTGLEFFRSELSPYKSAWFVLGGSQGSVPVVLKFASVLGIYGISCLMATANGWCVLALRYIRTRLVVLIAGICGLIGAGVASEIHEPLSPVRVAAIQTELPSLSQVEALVRNLVKKEPKTQLIVLPEYCFYRILDPAGEELDLIGALARELQVPIMVGGQVAAEGPPPNNFTSTIFMFDATGGMAYMQGKSVPVPFFIDGQPAGTRAPWNSPVGRLGVGICYDMDFTLISQDLVGQGAELLVFPTMDASHWGDVQHRQHAAMAPFRAVEQGRWLVRAASSGVTMFVSPDGTIVDELPMHLPGGADLSASVSLLRGRTIYARGGWLFPFATLAGSAVLMVWLIVLSARGGKPKPVEKSACEPGAD